MGNDLEVGARGNDDIIFTNLIKKASEAEFAKLVAYGDDNGVFNADEMTSKDALIAALPGLEASAKTDALEAAKSGEMFK